MNSGIATPAAYFIVNCKTQGKAVAKADNNVITLNRICFSIQNAGTKTKNEIGIDTKNNTET